VNTGRYLCIKEDELTVHDYSQISHTDTNSLFGFKQFDKKVAGTHVENWSLAYIRNAFQPKWVTENTWLSRWLKEVRSETVSGLAWKSIGAMRPSRGRELNNVQLAESLMSQTVFTQKEFDKFRIGDLRVDDFVQVMQVGDHPPAQVFFKPDVPSHFTDEERHLLRKVFRMSCTKARAEQQKLASATYDIFISYRQESDMGLVQLLYSHLKHLTVVENGAERQLRIFWDQKGLETGKNWQESFVHAITNSSLIISVLSAGTFTKIRELEVFLCHVRVCAHFRLKSSMNK